jgi:hypothetical protein
MHQQSLRHQPHCQPLLLLHRCHRHRQQQQHRHRRHQHLILILILVSG